jgi:hypothetical protein
MSELPENYDPRDDVDRASVLLKTLVDAKTELDLIEGRLIACALAHPEDQISLEDTEREGRRYLAKGTAITVPIVITADLLVKSFQHGSALHKRLAALQPLKFELFFKEVTRWEIVEDDGKKFRRLTREMLGEEAADFVNACLARDKDGIPKNSIKVD